MKNVKSLILMLLIPLAAVFMGCVDNIQQDLIVEIEESSDYGDSPYNMDDVEYFELFLYTYSDWEPILQGDILKKGDVLWLDNLEPGLYSLSGGAGMGDLQIGTVSWKSDKMVEIPINGTCDRYIVVDDISPTVVKLVVTFAGP